MTNPRAEVDPPSRRAAIRFVLLIGVVSFFADFTYEGARSVLGPYLALLGASSAAMGFITGFGEFVGYGLRLVSGRWADATQRFWPIAILGYVLQMAAVPALALAGSWQVAAALIVLERVGKAIRNPPRDVMLSHAGRAGGGLGRVFGIHEAMDQFGAMFGPLLVAAMLARSADYALAFGVLLVPAVINLAALAAARLVYPHPEALESAEPQAPDRAPSRLPSTFWVYLAAGALVAAGFADYPIIAFHLSRTGVAKGAQLAVFYSVAMAVSGTGSLLLGRLFDRYGFKVLIALTVVTAAYAPLAFFGGFWTALIGAAIWGLGMGVHESIIPAAVTPLVPVRRRASAFGLFTAGYGTAWFAGSAVIGVLAGVSVADAVAFCVLSQLAAVPLLIWVMRDPHRSREHGSRA